MQRDPRQPREHRRRLLRLKGYDYAQAGAYFVTICTQKRVCLFGEVVDSSMRLNDPGRLVARLWNEMPSRFPETDVDAFIVMPNHLHGIILLSDAAAIVGAPLVGAREGRRAATRAAPTIGDVIGAFKSLSTLAYMQGINESGWPTFNRHLWQRNYYEHIIRDESELSRVRRYIDENPLRWAFDQENPQRLAK